MIAAIIVTVCIVAALFAVYRHRQNALAPKNVGTGGRKDNTDYNAPKEIRSNELLSFEAEFYRSGDMVYKRERSYRFKMVRTENGAFAISEGYDEKLKGETDAVFAKKLQKIVRMFELARFNGIDRQTYGISEQYGPCRLNAEYDSGESINFFMDGDPNAEWSWAILDLFAKEFGRLGIDDLLPPKEKAAIKRFNMEYAFGDIRYCYGEIWIPVTEKEKARSFEDIMTRGRNYDECVKKAYSEVWHRVGGGKLFEDRYAEITKEHYQVLQKLVEETELIQFHNGNSFPNQFNYEDTPQYYEFYIEYESGKRLCGFSDALVACEKFKPIAEKFSQYYEDYLEKDR